MSRHGDKLVTINRYQSRIVRLRLILAVLGSEMAESLANSEDQSSLSFGWLRFRPRCLQILNTPRWFLFFLSQYFFTQSIVVNGIYPGSLSTIERRFGFTRYVYFCVITLDKRIYHFVHQFACCGETTACVSIVEIKCELV